jgi:hypothetical protein
MSRHPLNFMMLVSIPPKLLALTNSGLADFLVLIPSIGRGPRTDNGFFGTYFGGVDQIQWRTGRFKYQKIRYSLRRGGGARDKYLKIRYF